MEFRNLQEINKAYTEGIYSDSPLNRKLGRVGMTYQAYADKGDYIHSYSITSVKGCKRLLIFI